jgi:hypothetical protein
MAAVSLRTKSDPREFVYSRDKLEAVRHALCGESEGAVPLLIWPFRDLQPADPAFVAVNRLGAIGAIPLGEREIDFRADALAEPEFRQRVIELSRPSKHIPASIQPPKAENLSRGEFCTLWWKTIEPLAHREFVRSSTTDADGDGIEDREDPSLFTPGEMVRFKLAN